MVFWVVGLVLLAVALIVWGVRGKVVRVGPTCRRCTFDLSGLPTPLARCPECGSDLTKPHQVRPNLRRVRVVPLVVVGTAVIAALIAIVTGLPVFLVSPATQAKLPNAMLVGETYMPAQLARPALAELAARIQAKSIPRDTAERLVQRGLAVQAAPQVPWWFEWGDIVVAGRRAGWVSDADWVRYFRQGFRIEVDYASRIFVGSTLPLYMLLSGERLGGNIAAMDKISISPQILRDGVPITSGSSGTSLGSHALMLFEILFPDLHENIGTIKPGIAWIVQVQSELPDGPMYGEWRITLDKTIEVLPRDAHGATALLSDDTLMVVSSAIRVRSAQVSRFGETAQIDLQLRIGPIPCCIAFDVYVKSATGTSPQETLLGSLVSRKSDLETMKTITAHVRGLDLPPGRVDLILRPSPEQAAQSADCTEYLGHELMRRYIELIERNPEPER